MPLFIELKGVVAMNRHFLSLRSVFGLAMIIASMSLAAGCAVTESENVKTSGIWAHLELEHHPTDRITVLPS